MKDTIETVGSDIVDLEEAKEGDVVNNVGVIQSLSTSSVLSPKSPEKVISYNVPRYADKPPNKITYRGRIPGANSREIKLNLASLSTKKVEDSIEIINEHDDDDKDDDVKVEYDDSKNVRINLNLKFARENRNNKKNILATQRHLPVNFSKQKTSTNQESPSTSYTGQCSKEKLNHISAKLPSNKSVIKEKRDIFEYFDSKCGINEGQIEGQFLSDIKSVKTGDHNTKVKILNSSSVRTEKTKVAGSIVCQPNLTLRKPQSEIKKKRNSTTKKRKTVKEMRNELELRTMPKITHFFKKEVQIEQKDCSGESTPK